jgi:hypothetical protein
VASAGPDRKPAVAMEQRSHDPRDLAEALLDLVAGGSEVMPPQEPPRR